MHLQPLDAVLLHAGDPSDIGQQVAQVVRHLVGRLLAGKDDHRSGALASQPPVPRLGQMERRAIHRRGDLEVQS